MSQRQLFLQKLFESEPLSLIEMDYQQWLSLPEVIPTKPIKGKPLEQKKMQWRSMSELAGLMQHVQLVFIARSVTDANIYKINGRVRQILWESGELTPPKNLFALLYQLDAKEMLNLTDSFYPVHTKARVKMSIVDFYQEIGISLQSHRLKHGLIAEMLNIALRGKPAHLLNRSTYPPIDLKRAITLFKEELLLLDQLQLESSLFPTGVLAAAMIFLSIDKNHIEFFKKYNNGQGTTRNDKNDPVTALTKMVHYLKTAPGTQSKIQVELCSKTIRAILGWESGPNGSLFWMKQLRNTDIKPHVYEMRRIKGIIGEKEL